MTIPIIIALTTAQGCCWYGVLTNNHMGHVIEESIWTVTFALVGVAMIGCAHCEIGSSW